jgi:hypothetical protein
MSKLAGVGLAIGFILMSNWDSSLTGLAAQAEEATPRDSLAAQIRTQGYPCDKPLNATRDAKQSKPDEAAWILKCENAAYRIRLIPDMAAKVERISP